MNNLLEFLFKEPEKKHHAREIARACRLSPNSVLSFARELSKKGIVKMEKKGNLLEIGADLESQKYKLKKMIFNIESLYISGIVDFISGYYENARAIVLFGSYRRGEDISTSDIDIAVITNEKKRPNLRQFEKKLCRSIQLLPVNKGSMSEEFFNNLINGFVLWGHIEK